MSPSEAEVVGNGGLIQLWVVSPHNSDVLAIQQHPIPHGISSNVPLPSSQSSEWLALGFQTHLVGFS